jgi:phosphoenolpyruvate carboxykinase (ATP)
LTFLTNIKPGATRPSDDSVPAADANGVLPPVARLTPDQAMLVPEGYTSKLAARTGIIDPESTFSCFEELFMPRVLACMRDVASDTGTLAIPDHTG